VVAGKRDDGAAVGRDLTSERRDEQEAGPGLDCNVSIKALPRCVKNPGGFIVSLRINAVIAPWSLATAPIRPSGPVGVDRSQG
jgi:hypothetical protein